MKKIQSLFLALLITITSVFGTACEDDDKDVDEAPVAGEVVCHDEDHDMSMEEAAGESAGEEMDDMTLPEAINLLESLIPNTDPMPQTI